MPHYLINDSSLYSQSSRKKVERKGDTLSKTFKGVIVCERPRETEIRLVSLAYTRAMLGIVSVSNAAYIPVRYILKIYKHKAPILVGCGL